MITEPTIIVYDLETTGLNANTNRIIQISARKCERQEDGTYKEAESRTWYIKQAEPLPQRIVDLTGITDEILEDKPTEEELAEEVIRYFGAYPVVGYNNEGFDNLFMYNFFQRNGFLFDPCGSCDMMKEAKERIPRNKVSRYTLKNVAKHLGADKGITYHNAEGDTQATLNILNTFIKD